MAKPSLDDYVDVAERIAQFKEKFPDGTLQRIGNPEVLSIGNQSYIVYTAAAYREQGDERPGVGTAWEKVPGATPYTRDSELMNAETAAWGRAIVALGFATKKIASAQEVKARQGESATPKADGPNKPAAKAAAPKPAEKMPKEAGDRLLGMLAETGMDWPSIALWLSTNGVSQTEDHLEAVRELSPGKAKELVAWAKGGSDASPGER